MVFVDVVLGVGVDVELVVVVVVVLVAAVVVAIVVAVTFVGRIQIKHGQIRILPPNFRLHRGGAPGDT